MRKMDEICLVPRKGWAFWRGISLMSVLMFYTFKQSIFITVYTTCSQRTGADNTKGHEVAENLFPFTFSEYMYGEANLTLHETVKHKFIIWTNLAPNHR